MKSGRKVIKEMAFQNIRLFIYETKYVFDTHNEECLSARVTFIYFDS